MRLRINFKVMNTSNYALPETVAQRAIQHMNEDHADALLRYAHYFGERPSATAATMTGLDADGFDLSLLTSAGREDVRIPFRDPLQCDQDAHTRLVAMAVEARKALAV